MSLSARMKKGALRSPEAATPATPSRKNGPTVASVATVAGTQSLNDPIAAALGVATVASVASTSPKTPGYRPNPPPMTAGEKAAIKAWLFYIGEYDPLMIGEVLRQCFSNAEARAYYLNRADQISGHTQDVGVTTGGIIVAVETYSEDDEVEGEG